MTKEEFSKIIKGLKAVYTDPKFIPDKEAFDVWYAFFRDDEYKVIALRAQRHIAISKWPPTIAELRAPIETDHMDGMEAWALVKKALRNGTYGFEEEYSKLPPIVQKAVGSPLNIQAWASLDPDTNASVTQSNFLKAFNAAVARDREEAKLPDRMKGLIESTLKQIGTDDGRNCA